MKEQLISLDRETLIGMLDDFAKNWLAHDGLWFQAIERHTNMTTAIELDEQAWAKFSAIEAKRIMARHQIKSGSGLEGLHKALQFRMYALLNIQKFANVTESSFEFYMVDCRVQRARREKGLPAFPCKSVGIIEYDLFARTIDERITTSCICCPPDPQAGADHWCGWKFCI
jgi:hypothetical protein